MIWGKNHKFENECSGFYVNRGEEKKKRKKKKEKKISGMDCYGFVWICMVWILGFLI